MFAPAHAWSAESAATIVRDRAVCRLSVITAELRQRGAFVLIAGREVSFLASMPERDFRRYMRASEAARSASRMLFGLQCRHTMWHRAILRAFARREARP